MQVWVAREKNDGNTRRNSVVLVTDQKPFKTNSEAWDFESKQGLIYNYFSAPGFKKAFKFTPRKGSCKQYNLTLTEVKENASRKS